MGGVGRCYCPHCNGYFKGVAERDAHEVTGALGVEQSELRFFQFGFRLFLPIKCFWKFGVSSTSNP